VILILKRASRPSGEWSDDDDYDVLADGVVVGRISGVARRFARGCRRWPLGITRSARTHGHEPTREAVMAAFGNRKE
jgi:hypothetical protein